MPGCFKDTNDRSPERRPREPGRDEEDVHDGEGLRLARARGWWGQGIRGASTVDRNLKSHQTYAYVSPPYRKYSRCRGIVPAANIRPRRRAKNAYRPRFKTTTARSAAAARKRPELR